MKKRILFCEDDRGIIDATCLLLEEDGYDIKIVESGSEVMAAVSSYKPDIILLDLWLPDINGDILAKKIKSRSSFRNIPLIILSASRDAEIVAKEVGAEGYLAKPFEIDELESLVGSLLAEPS